MDYKAHDNLARKTQHSCIRGYPSQRLSKIMDYKGHDNLARKSKHSCIRGYPYNAFQKSWITRPMTI